MATYNGAKYLQQQLDSFVGQTRLPDELIVSDDCSTDQTVEIIQRFAKVAPFDVILNRNEENFGYAGNFNRALMNTTGDLVFLSDQDDVWFPEKIQRVAQVAEKSNALVIMNDAGLTDASLNDTGLTKLGQIRSGGLSRSSFVMGCCAAIKRDLLSLCLPIIEGYRAHDKWIGEFADGMKRKKIIPEVMQWYRRHEFNESNSIASQTSKLSRLTVLHNFVHYDHMPLDYQREQLGLLLDGVFSAKKRAIEPYASELQNFEVSVARKRRNLVQREKIRACRRWRRIFSVYNLWRYGGYAEFSGFKSAIRDIIFK